jgi:photosystem II stability/assembly factor-like uncharacterized protein
MVNKLRFYMAANRAELRVTRDGGLSWQTERLPRVGGLAYADREQALLIRLEGTAPAPPESGLWALFGVPQDSRDVVFTDRQEGWVLARKNDQAPSHVYHTCTGGREWAKLDLELGSGARAIHGRLTGQAWVVEADGHVTLFEDHGKTWRRSRVTRPALRELIQRLF